MEKRYYGNHFDKYQRAARLARTRRRTTPFGALYLLKLSGNQMMYRNVAAQLDRRHELHNPGGEVALKQAQHCTQLALDFGNGYVFRRRQTVPITTKGSPKGGSFAVLK